MKITHDEKHNIGYILLKKGKVVVNETIVINDDMNIDMAEDGSVIGIELLNANEQIGNKIEIDKSGNE